MYKHELFEELDAFDPQWQNRYPSVLSAAAAAKCKDLLNQWLDTPEGEVYLTNVAAVRDYMAEIEQYRRQVEAEQSALPFGYGSLGSLKGEYFND